MMKALLLYSLAFVLMTPSNSISDSVPGAEIAAFHVHHFVRLDAAQPAPEWEFAHPITFSADWQGKNSDPQHQTEVRILWSAETLYLRFVCRYKSISVFSDSDPS